MSETQPRFKDIGEVLVHVIGLLMPTVATTTEAVIVLLREAERDARAAGDGDRVARISVVAAKVNQARDDLMQQLENRQRSQSSPAPEQPRPPE